MVDEDDPVDFCGGSRQWKLRLEELIPAGSPQITDTEGGFTLRVESETVTEYYYRCCWTSVRREYTRQGLRRIRTGICLARQEVRNG